MFSVPGWNLSAPLATQVEKPKVKEGGAPEGKKSQKRRQKREQRQQVEIDEGNVGEYWEKVVGGKDSEQQTKPSETSNAIAPPNAEGNAEKAGKKRKRKSDKKAPLESEEGKPQEEDASKADTANEASKRDKKKRKKDHKPAPTSDNAVKPAAQPSAATTVPPLIPEPSNLTPLQKSMRAKLISARFRHLNESLYTKPSKESLDLFKDNPDMFEDYHRGFAQQVEVWPENPVDGYVDAVLSRGKLRTKEPWKDKKRQDKNNKKGGNNDKVSKEDSNDAVSPSSTLKPLPRNARGHCTIADLGCGTASLSYRLQPSLKPLNLTLHSFDLSKPTGPTANLVTIADISALPLPDSSVDVAIFCLALMGTNWLDFIDEAWRILRWRGELWVSEIKSRFGRVGRAKGAPPINSVGSLRKVEKKTTKVKGKGGKKESGAEKEGPQDSDDEAELATQVDGVETGQEGTDVSAFVAALRARGFVLDAPVERPMEAVDLGNKMFVKMQFVKGVAPTKGKNVDAAKEREKGMGKGGPPGAMRMGMKGKKFAAVVGGDDEEGDAADAKVLKPCLYKIR